MNKTTSLNEANIKTDSQPGRNRNVSVRFSAVAPTSAYWVLLIQLAGALPFQINRASAVLEQADACLLRPSDHCRFLDKQNPDCLSFLVDEDYIRSLSILMDANLYSNLVQDSQPLRFTLSETRMAALEQKIQSIKEYDPASTEYSRSCMLLFQELYVQFLAQHSYEPPKYPEWLTSLIVSLQDVNLFGVPMSQIASTTPYSYSRLSRLFQNYTGVSLIDYVTDVKIRYAKQLLRSTDMTMLAIASKLEFSISYFNKLFKRKVGITPGEYRKNHREI